MTFAKMSLAILIATTLIVSGAAPSYASKNTGAFKRSIEGSKVAPDHRFAGASTKTSGRQNAKPTSALAHPPPKNGPIEPMTSLPWASKINVLLRAEM